MTKAKKKDIAGGLYFAFLMAAGLYVRYKLIQTALKPGYISKYYTLVDLAHSDTANTNGIYNVPDDQVIKNASEFALNFLDPLTEKLGYLVKHSWNSWYRTGELTHFLNTDPQEKGGYKYSDHETGFAVDLDSPGNVNNHEIVYTILKENYPFKQLILERGSWANPQWIHVSQIPGQNNGEILFYNGYSYTTVSRSALESLYGL